MIVFRELKECAKNDLRGNWPVAIGAGLLAGLLGAGGSGVASGFNVDVSGGETTEVTPEVQNFMQDNLWLILAIFFGAMLIGVVVSLLFTSVIQVGYARFNLDLVEGNPLMVTTLFDGFKNWGSVVLTFALQTLIVFLKTLLFIIPGIMASYDYAMVRYILAENPHIGAKEALATSKRMMRGHRMELFCLQMSFFGWILLCVLTCGIGTIWLNPYMEATNANFYKALSGAEEPDFSYQTV